jgi:hypothetical protein
VDEHNRVEIIHNDQGNKTTPSFVAFTDEQRLIGDAAKNQAAANPQNTVFGTFYIYVFAFNTFLFSPTNISVILVFDLAMMDFYSYYCIAMFVGQMNDNKY